jgi:hypothetical protein
MVVVVDPDGKGREGNRIRDPPAFIVEGSWSEFSESWPHSVCLRRYLRQQMSDMSFPQCCNPIHLELHSGPSSDHQRVLTVSRVDQPLIVLERCHPLSIPLLDR